MKNNIDELLKMTLAPTDVPDERLNNQVLSKIKERKYMTNKRRIPAAALIAVLTLILGSVTVLAAHHYLNPSEIATEFKNDTLKNAFLSENALYVNETQESDGYNITLLGTVAGKNISDDDLFTDSNGIPKDDRIYTVIAIEHADGTPMPNRGPDEYSREDFYVSHYIHGLNPKDYSLTTMGGVESIVVKDGIEYRIMEMDNIEIFADKGIYVGVSSGIFYDADAYIYDENTGDITRNPNYDGVNALFKLPIDVNKADPAAADMYLKQLQNSWNMPDEDIEYENAEMNETDLAVKEFIQSLTSENINEYAYPIESTKMICTPDADGMIYFEYEFENSSENLSISIEDVFPKDSTDVFSIAGYNYSEDGLSDLLIKTCTLNEDGTVTFVLYKSIVQN